jgi:hypothetical protein
VPGLDLLKLKQSFHELQKLGARVLHQAELLGLLGVYRSRYFVQHEPGEPLNRVEGSLELVAHTGEELPLRHVGRLQRTIDRQQFHRALVDRALKIETVSGLRIQKHLPRLLALGDVDE